MIVNYKFSEVFIHVYTVRAGGIGARQYFASASSGAEFGTRSSQPGDNSGHDCGDQFSDADVATGGAL
jgi:hypothetical protein